MQRKTNVQRLKSGETTVQELKDERLAQLRRLRTAGKNQVGATHPQEEVSLPNIDVDVELSKEKLVGEILLIDKELLQLSNEAAKLRGVSVTLKAEKIKLSMSVLKQRSDLLLRLLNKTMPDQRAVVMDVDVEITAKRSDEIPDDILNAAIAGTLTAKQVEGMELIISPEKKMVRVK